MFIFFICFDCSNVSWKVSRTTWTCLLISPAAMLHWVRHSTDTVLSTQTTIWYFNACLLCIVFLVDCIGINYLLSVCLFFWKCITFLIVMCRCYSSASWHKQWWWWFSCDVVYNIQSRLRGGFNSYLKDILDISWYFIWWIN